MNAIPTKYKGVQFRSRLEARWAALFDLVWWRWDYEPFDLAGWIPDFYVDPTWAPDGRGLLVEVKPHFSLDQFDVDFYRTRLESCGIPRCGGVALLGARVERYYLGRKADAPQEALEGAQAGWFINGAPQGFVPSGYWHSTPDEYRFKPGEVNVMFLGDKMEGWEGEEAWREAGNIVQWKSPR